MHACVSCEVAFVRKTLVTLGTHIRVLTCVHSHVCREPIAGHEAFDTNGTCVWSFTGVFSHVHREAGLLCITFATPRLGTNIRSHICVHHEITLIRKRFAAIRFWTCIWALPVCIFMCVLNVFCEVTFFINDLPQSGSVHTYGRSPVWALTCLANALW